MEDWITQNEAAEISKKSLQTINNWIRRGRVKTTEKYGKTLVSREDILNFTPNKGGRPPKTKEDETLKTNPASGLEREN